MTELLNQAKDNLGFILMCIAIVVALSLLSKFAEKFFRHRHGAACAGLPPAVPCPRLL